MLADNLQLLQAAACGPDAMPQLINPLVATLRLREQHRDAYWRTRDPINEDRLLWRAHAFRHTVHLLPGQTILELGCGEGRFTRALATVSRGENPLTTVTFQAEMAPESAVPVRTERLSLKAFPGVLAGRKFDFVVAMDILDDRTSSELLQYVMDVLEPGGEVIFYESNPWNPIYRIRSAIARLSGRPDPRSLISRRRLYELVSEIGFIRVYAVYNDFVFAPLTQSLIWVLRNLSILLENAPLVSRMAGAILVHAQKPPRKREIVGVSLCTHAALRGAVSVVIPCHNEEMNVEPLTQGILALYGDYIHEMILVNDGSTDATRQIVDALAAKDSRIKPLHRPPPNGVGRAISDGLKAATGEYVLTMDCDFLHLLPELRDLFDATQTGCDVVVGSRFSRASVLLNYPFQKIIANRAFHLLARLLLREKFRDLTNNLKLLRREVVRDLMLRQPGFAVNAETGLQPLLLGYRVREVPISWINRTPGMGSSSFRLMQVGGGYWQALLGLWTLKTFRSGPYRQMSRTKASM